MVLLGVALVIVGAGVGIGIDRWIRRLRRIRLETRGTYEQWLFHPLLLTIAFAGWILALFGVLILIGVAFPTDILID